MNATLDQILAEVRELRDQVAELRADAGRDRRWLSMREAARRFARGRGTLQRLIDAGAITARRERSRGRQGFSMRLYLPSIESALKNQENI